MGLLEVLVSLIVDLEVVESILAGWARRIVPVEGTGIGAVTRLSAPETGTDPQEALWCCGTPGVVNEYFCVIGNGRRRATGRRRAIL